MSISGLRFGHVAFKVADTERSVRWYSDAFGAKKIYHAEAQGDRPELIFLEFARTMRRAFHGRQKPVAFASRPDWLHPLLFDRR
jgi:catechol 2,3-dioxygenase-like lactoylglutathione lyase family enzyme